MAQHLKAAFDPAGVMLPVAKILPMKKVVADPKKSPTVRRIAASIRQVGLIEPLVIYPQQGRGGFYSLLEGHVRLEILKQMGVEEVFCIIATEDEAYTYNHKVNQVSPIQEHFMIMKAIQDGVSESRIAASLDVDVAKIRQKRDLLKGICPEAVELLKDKKATAGALRELRKVKPMRQIEMAELMVACNNFAASYAKGLVAATPQEQMNEPDKAKELKGIRPEDMARMEKELASLSDDFRAVEESHGRNVLHLVLSVAYLRKLLDNAAVVRFLSQHYADVLAEFQKVVAAANLEGGQ